MSSRSALVRVSSIQLATQLVGLVVALRRRRYFDFVPLGWRGSPETVGRDSVLTGTALSAPGVMLAVQVAATARLGRAPSLLAGRCLGFLGWANIAGYLGERLVRQRLTPGGWDPLESPIAAVGVAGALGMTALGLDGGGGPTAG